MGTEIEKKYLVKTMPENINAYPCHMIEQGYLNVYPAIRVRREDDIYYMTYKAERKGVVGEIGKTEYNMPLDEVSYMHLAKKADGNVIRKCRYLIPLNPDAFDDEYLKAHPMIGECVENGSIKIELDVFKEPFQGRVIAEVEFPDEDSAKNYRPAEWFGEEVTGRPEYSNAHMSAEKLNDGTDEDNGR